MKNLLFIAAVGLLVSCNSPETESVAVDRSIGFNTQLPELKWQLGTEDAVQLVKDLDKLWAAENYEAMRPFLSDTAECYFEDGRVAKSGDEFIKILSEDDEGEDVSWTFDYAFSVDLDPSRGGEHVQAGFTGTEVKEGLTTKKRYHESYYIVDGKIVMWSQYSMDIKE
ncbi:MAG: hypothetical protein K9H49_03785 [Bacteroidales bacterium]|nr:hypothetical protein [Bacteroidales bacterium]MCF8389412.1 hypothetical protein [Bacteroidales bacterium]